MTVQLVSCWFCGRQAQRDPGDWPVGMDIAIRDRDDTGKAREVTWQCTDDKGCLRRTMDRLVNGPGAGSAR